MQLQKSCGWNSVLHLFDSVQVTLFDRRHPPAVDDMVALAVPAMLQSKKSSPFLADLAAEFIAPLNVSSGQDSASPSVFFTDYLYTNTPGQPATACSFYHAVAHSMSGAGCFVQCAPVGCVWHQRLQCSREPINS